MGIDDYNRDAMRELPEEANADLYRLGVIEFQSTHRLKPDGWNGPKTQALLRAMFGGGALTASTDDFHGAIEAPRGYAGIKEVFGSFDYIEDTKQKGGIIIDRAWVRANIQEVVLFHGRRCWLHRKVATGFADLYQKACDESGYVPERIGTWVPRHILWKPDRNLSTHSWGIAFDANAHENGYGKPIAETAIGKHIRFAEVFEEAGWIWGGRWKVPDCQHLQFAHPG